jgi:hypothetical protein
MASQDLTIQAVQKNLHLLQKHKAFPEHTRDTVNAAIHFLSQAVPALPSTTGVQLENIHLMYAETLESVHSHFRNAILDAARDKYKPGTIVMWEDDISGDTLDGTVCDESVTITTGGQILINVLSTGGQCSVPSDCITVI